MAIRMVTLGGTDFTDEGVITADLNDTLDELQRIIENTSTGHIHNGTDSKTIAKESHVVILPRFYSAVIQGTWADANADSFYLGRSFGNLSTKADGDEVNYKIALQKGTYKLYLMTRAYVDTPIIKVRLGGTLLATFDTYQAGEDNDHEFSQASISIATDGLQTLRVYADGKNASSSHHLMYLQAIVFVRTA